MIVYTLQIDSVTSQEIATVNVPSLQGKVSEEEWAQRVELAALYRLTALYGWSDLVFTHISARVPGPEHHFLINPYGFLFEEITASSLLKVDQQCNKLDDSPLPVNPAGFTIHSCIHAGREDAHCVMHTHSRAGVAVSAQKEGVLPISQQSTLVLSSIGYHDYEGVALREDEQPRLQANLGHNQFLVLRNHGLLTVAGSVPDTFLLHYLFETTCQIQISAQAGDSLNLIDPAIQGDTKAVVDTVLKGMGGQIAWPALLRKLDRIDGSYKT
jgi:ribulose-5-phosphate 4-epimerase/fuculose-1-phosphate aldolase